MTIFLEYSFSCPKISSHIWTYSHAYTGVGGGKRAYITSFTIKTGGLNAPFANSGFFNFGNTQFEFGGGTTSIKRLDGRSGIQVGSPVNYTYPKAETTGDMLIIIYNDETLNNKVFFKNGPDTVDNRGYTINMPGVEVDNTSADDGPLRHEIYQYTSVTFQSWRLSYLPAVYNYCEWTKEQVDANAGKPWTDPAELSKLLIEPHGSPKGFDEDFQAPGGLNILPNVWMYKASVIDDSWKSSVTSSVSNSRIIRNIIGGFADNESVSNYIVPR